MSTSLNRVVIKSRPKSMKGLRANIYNKYYLINNFPHTAPNCLYATCRKHESLKESKGHTGMHNLSSRHTSMCEKVFKLIQILLGYTDPTGCWPQLHQSTFMLLPSKYQCKIQCLHQELKKAVHAQNDPFGGVIMKISRICLHTIKIKSLCYFTKQGCVLSPVILGHNTLYLKM